MITKVHWGLGTNRRFFGNIVSNHGGRQLDGMLSSIRMLLDILDTVGDKIEVHIDGGIRSGQDVLKAYAMGVKGTYIGRVFLYGLGAMDGKVVAKTLEIIHKEFDTSMVLHGHRQLTNVNKSDLLIPKNFKVSDTHE